MQLVHRCNKYNVAGGEQGFGLVFTSKFSSDIIFSPLFPLASKIFSAVEYLKKKNITN